jgi:hypothetical protein
MESRPKMLNKFTILLKKVYRRLKRWHDLYVIHPKEWWDLRLIHESGLFDRSWYLAKNPDIALAKANPVHHYLRYGGFEGRDPGPYFCSNRYLNAFEDVRKEGINPLIHYLKYGRRKGYETQSPKMDFINSVYCPECENKVTDFLPFNSRKSKIFCIGYNKTGTTSIGQALENFGYQVGIQTEAELLMGDWAMRDFRRIIQFCKTADAFQDVPFSLDFTYEILDYEFPSSKFILTVRNDADEWYESLIRFYGKLTGVNGIPTADDLKKYTGGGKGWLWRQQEHIYGVDESTLFDKKIYKARYTDHNDQILEYFKYRSKDLLILNLSDPSSMRSLSEFLGIKYIGQEMPHLNKSGN